MIGILYRQNCLRRLSRYSALSAIATIALLTVPTLLLASTDLRGIRILHSHYGNNTSPDWTLVNDVRARGATVDVFGSQTNPYQLLDGYHVLWLTKTTDVPTGSDLTALFQWANDGSQKGILITARSVQVPDIINAISSALGAGVSASLTTLQPDTTSSIEMHPTTDGIGELVLSARWTELTSIASPGSLLVSDTSDRWVAAYSTPGNARIVVICDTPFSGNIHNGDNRLFGNQIIDWLALPPGAVSGVPIMEISPDTIEVQVNVGDSAQAGIFIQNHGVETLDFEILQTFSTVQALSQLEDLSAMVNSASGAANDKVILADNFEDQNLDGWQASPSFVISGETGANGSTYSCHESNATFGSFDGARQNLSSGDFRYVSFWVRSGSTVTDDGYFVLSDVNGVPAIFFYATGDGTFWINGDVGGNSSFSYNADTWYHIVLSDIDYVTKTFDYWVDGSLLQADVPFRFSVIVDELGRLDLFCFSPGSQAWWDQIFLLSDASAEWFKATPSSGMLPLSESTTVSVSIDATSIVPGTHETFILIESNAPDDRYHVVCVRAMVDTVVTSVDVGWPLPRFSLAAPYPNPFNPSTNLIVSIYHDAPATLLVFDVTGKSIRTLFDRSLHAGVYTVQWDGRDDGGAPVASGIYLFRLEVAGSSKTRKGVVLK